MIVRSWKLTKDGSLSFETSHAVSRPRKWSKQDLEVAHWDHHGAHATLELCFDKERFEIELSREELRALSKQILEVLEIGEKK